MLIINRIKREKCVYHRFFIYGIQRQHRYMEVNDSRLALHFRRSVFVVVFWVDWKYVGK